MIETMLGLIDIAGAFCHLPGSKQEYWTGLVLELEAKTRAWHRSDKTRLKPGSIQLDTDGMTVDTETLEHILKQIGAELAHRCTAALASCGPGAV